MVQSSAHKPNVNSQAGRINKKVTQKFRELKSHDPNFRKTHSRKSITSLLQWHLLLMSRNTEILVD